MPYLSLQKHVTVHHPNGKGKAGDPVALRPASEECFSSC